MTETNQPDPISEYETLRSHCLQRKRDCLDVHVLTFDLEDWFHLLDLPETADPNSWSGFQTRFQRNLDLILEVLGKRGQPATFFCLGWIAKEFPAEIRAISDMGHEIGSHSMVHSLVYRQTPQAFRAEVRESIETIQDITGERVRAYRAPGFSITRDSLWAFDVLASLGIQIDCSIFPAERAHGGITGLECTSPHWIDTPSGALKSFPMNTKTIAGQRLVFTGGGYFRIMPSALIERWIEEAPYIMTYFHPRDFDPEQPRLKGLSAFRRFKSYVGIKHALPKLERILDKFEMIDLAEAENRIDWATASRVNMG